MSEKDSEVKAEWDQQQEAATTIRSIGLPELQDEVVERFTHGVYNRLECRAGWGLMLAGLAAVFGFFLYEILTEPEAGSVLRIGLVAVLVGFVMLISGVWRCRRRVARSDPYKEVVR